MWTTWSSGPTPPTSDCRARCGATDGDRAADVAGRLECGTAWVNTHLALAPQQPFGGFKWSGVGVENGPWGLAEFSEIQVVYRSKGTDGLNLNTGGLVS